MLRQSEHGLEKNFDTEHFRRECLLKAGSRDNAGIANAVGRPPDKPGRIDAFHGLEANFYTLITKKMSAGGLALGDWLGHYRVITGVITCLIWGQEGCL